MDDFHKASKEMIRQVRRDESSDVIHITKCAHYGVRRSDVACNSGSELNIAAELSRVMRAIGIRINRTVAANSRRNEGMNNTKAAHRVPRKYFRRIVERLS